MILLAILTGILTALVVRRTTNASALRAAARKIHADLLEFRLFFDEPWLIWQAWMSLLRDNLRLFRLFLPATVILALPVAWLVLQLETVYGLRPLHPGEAAVVTVQMKRPLDPADHLELQGRAGIQVETPPVRVVRDNQVVWRIRSVSDGHGEGELTVNGRIVRKSIAIGDAPTILSPRRSSSLVEFLLHPEEPRLPEGDIVWLQVGYPMSQSAIPWLVWFLGISAAAALVSVRWLKVLN